MARVRLHVLDPDDVRSRTVEVNDGTRLEIKGPLTENEAVWVVIEAVEDDE